MRYDWPGSKYGKYVIYSVRGGSDRCSGVMTASVVFLGARAVSDSPICGFDTVMNLKCSWLARLLANALVLDWVWV